MQVIYHDNNWYWGDTTTIITTDSLGMVELQYDNKYPSIAFIRGLSVHYSARKGGIGNALLDLCKKEAIKRGKKFLQLNVQKDSWLVQWYERRGFTTIFEDDNEFTMWKQIIH